MCVFPKEIRHVHYVRDVEAAGSNPVIPIVLSPQIGIICGSINFDRQWT